LLQILACLRRAQPVSVSDREPELCYLFWDFCCAALLQILWVGRILEKRIGTALTGAIYVCSVLSSAAVILLVHSWYPKSGATVGASGGMFGLVGAALVLSYRHAGFVGQASRLRTWLWLVLFMGFAISFLPEISMAGHLGGLIGGPLVASVARVRENASPSAAANG